MGIIKQKIISTSILLSPSDLDSWWRERLIDRLRSTMTGKCLHDHGYILEIQRIVRITDQVLTRIDGRARFFIDILVVLMKPVVGAEIDATVEMIFPHGIFCCYRMMRMMIPLSKCPGFTIRHDFSMISIVNVSTGVVIRKNDTIRVRIRDIRFENDLYSCIAALAPSKEKRDVKEKDG